MKFFNKLLLIATAAVLVWGCKKDETRTVVGNAQPGTLTASATELVLEEGNAANQALTLSWTPADFGYSAGINYSLELAPAGTNFASPKTINLGTSKTVSYTVAQLNQFAAEMELAAFEENGVEARIRANITETYPPVYSNVVTLTITPYLTEPPYATLYMVGDATEFDWDNGKATPMFRDATDPFIYTYTGKFDAGNVKFLGVLGQWAPMWGQNGATTLQFRETEADADPASIQIATAGYYTIKVNLRNNTYSVEAVATPGAATFTAPVGIIGAFNGWGAIVPMANTTFNPHIWNLVYTFDTDADGELKFRHSPDWNVNWGPSEENREQPYGVSIGGGKNIKVKAGTYRILFNDVTGEYVFIPQ